MARLLNLIKTTLSIASSKMHCLVRLGFLLRIIFKEKITLKILC